MNSSAATMLSEQDIRAYHDDGAMVLRGVVSPLWLTRIADAIARDIAEPGPFVHGYPATGGKGRFHGNLRIWEHDAELRDFCLNSPLPGLAACLLGSENVNLLYDQMFVKEASTPNPTRWHNDQPYWPIRGWQVLSFWLSPDPVTRDSGALEFIRGSHKWHKFFQPERFGETEAHDDYERNPDYLTIPDIDAARGDYDIVSWDLEPGDLYVFHALTVHGAGGNVRGDVRRRGYTVRYTGDDIHYDTRSGTNEHLRSPEFADGDALTAPRYPQVWPR
jgi:ectoine hydroxylase-related dioxygenase (phytanoyl-CoA dioxygenase family)